MRRLVVKDFSCIKNANLELSRLTVIIGPQASGKSVLSKLMYFFTSLLSENSEYVGVKGFSFDELKSHVIDKFVEWFPPSAWGSKRFSIEFTYGKFKIRVIRRTRAGNAIEKISVSICPEYKQFYTGLYENLAKTRDLIERRVDIDYYDAVWKARDTAESSLRKWLNGEQLYSQVFVPAGRSFFTSVGRTLVAFEHAKILDPVTLAFGRRYTALRERRMRRMMLQDRPTGMLANVLFRDILGGDLKLEGEKEYVETADGRLIPFSALSSGQQELLPLAMTISGMLPEEPGAGRRQPSRFKTALCIEEPEAHLFPRAQNILVEVLASMVSPRTGIELMLTTHSPYVLAKINNLIKAGWLVKKRGASKRISEILPLQSWLLPGFVGAYAIVDGNLHSIIDEDGLVAADYLDDVSGDIAREFSMLMEVELSH